MRKKSNGRRTKWEKGETGQQLEVRAEAEPKGYSLKGRKEKLGDDALREEKKTLGGGGR